MAELDKIFLGGETKIKGKIQADGKIYDIESINEEGNYSELESLFTPISSEGDIWNGEFITNESSLSELVGAGTENNPYIISDMKDFLSFKYRMEYVSEYIENPIDPEMPPTPVLPYSGKYWKLTSDLYFNKMEDLKYWKTNPSKLNEFISIGSGMEKGSSLNLSFEVNFNGGGHSLFGIFQTTDSNPYGSSRIGLFNSIEGDSSSIKNLNLEYMIVDLSEGQMHRNVGCLAKSVELWNSFSADNIKIKSFVDIGLSGVFGAGWGFGNLFGHFRVFFILSKITNIDSEVNIYCSSFDSSLKKRSDIRKLSGTIFNVDSRYGTIFHNIKINIQENFENPSLDDNTSYDIASLAFLYHPDSEDYIVNIESNYSGNSGLINFPLFHEDTTFDDPRLTKNIPNIYNYLAYNITDPLSKNYQKEMTENFKYPIIRNSILKGDFYYKLRDFSLNSFQDTTSGRLYFTRKENKFLNDLEEKMEFYIGDSKEEKYIEYLEEAFNNYVFLNPKVEVNNSLWGTVLKETLPLKYIKKEGKKLFLTDRSTAENFSDVQNKIDFPFEDKKKYKKVPVLKLLDGETAEIH